MQAPVASPLLSSSFGALALTQLQENLSYSNITNKSNYNKSNYNFDSNFNNNITNDDRNDSFFDEGEYVARAYGDRYLSQGKTWVLSIIYVIILCTGLFGNICTCIVIYKNKAMHTATNYYLFSLAVSDVTTLIFGFLGLCVMAQILSLTLECNSFDNSIRSAALPPELYSIWEAYPWRLGVPFCLIKSFISEMTSYASVLTITAFTLERYVAICHPIRSQRITTLSRVTKTIVGIWLTACLCALPFPLHTELIHIRHPTTNEPLELSVMCNVPHRWLPRMMYVFQISTFVFFLTPMTIITVLYTLIGVRLRNSEIQAETSKTENTVMNTVTKARKAVIKMLVAVVVSFFVCWAPFNAQRLMTVYIGRDQWTDSLIDFQAELFYVSGILFFFNSTVNPLLYNLISRRYRKAFKRTICNNCFKCERRTENHANEKSVHRSSRTYLSQYPSRTGQTAQVVNSVKRPTCSTIMDSRV